jgi:hypothetical protein
MSNPSLSKPGLRRLADGLTIARGALGLPLVLALSLGWPWLAWGLLLRRDLAARHADQLVCQPIPPL